MKFGRAIIMWLVLFSIGLLAALSAVESFFGAQNAKSFFNTTPLIIYWCAVVLLLAAGLAMFPRLLRRPGSLMMHLGCLLVVAGSMWASQTGHRIAETLFRAKKIPTGYMLIPEGHSENHLTSGDSQQVLGELPFSIRLNKFSIEYYQNDDSGPRLFVRTPEGASFQLPAKAGNSISLGQDKGRLTIVRVFKNFKMQLADGEKKALDAEGNANPAVEVRLELPGGHSHSSYAFERFKHPQEDGLDMTYVSSQRPQAVRSYLSDLTVIDNGKETARKTIEVNNPLHYGGYHFYQHSYDTASGSYTVLSVTSDSGLYVVFAGYLLLCLGALWHFWIDPSIKYLRNRKSQNGAAYNGI
ncbi:MAG: hypothetical protein C0404_01430 [Verrucomicrobia bacterium]|nr:hypothetical protein [Verrucomicrobiota bacterium]